MDARFTDEQDEIRRTLRELLGKRCGPEELRAAVDTPAGHDPALWTTLAEQLGLPGLALPETYGGVGCTATELALACEETGRALAPTPLFATAVLAAPLLLALGTDTQRAELLPRIAELPKRPAGACGGAPREAHNERHCRRPDVKRLHGLHRGASVARSRHPYPPWNSPVELCSLSPPIAW